MVWIFAAVALILLVAIPGFRRTCGWIVAAIVLFAVAVQVHDHFERKAAAVQISEPDPCAGLKNSAHLDCLLAEKPKQ